MYLLFRHHHILPSQVADMGMGEKIVVRAFMHYQIEKRNEELTKIQEQFG